MDPMMFLQMIKSGKNPQQLMLQYLETQMKGTPMGDNLLALARGNRTQDIEQIARNICTQRGVDYDKEFSSFKQ